MKENKQLVVLLAVFLLVIIALGMALLYYFLGAKPDDEDAVVIPIEERFISTPEAPYDTSFTDAEEALKYPIGSSDLAFVKSILTPMVATGRWTAALDYLEEYFETHSYRSEEGAELKRYQADLTVMIQMGDFPVEVLDIMFMSFEAPETFLACMIYYPFSIKRAGFLSNDSLVPITETNNVAFYTLEPESTGAVLKKVNLHFNDQYYAAWVQEFEVDGVRLRAYLVQKKDGTWRVYRITTDDEKSYFMTVEKWVEQLGM